MIHPCLIPDGQVIIFNFPAGAGGKMLQNCVGLSRHCVLNKLLYTQWQLNYDQEITQAFYKQKLSWILKTLPMQNKLHKWLDYEFKELDIYGINFLGFNAHVPILHQEIYQLASKKLWSTVTVHNFGAVEHYNNYWPSIKHVCLVNNKIFSTYALSKKNPELKYDNDWEELGRTPDGLAFCFDVDNTMFNTVNFIEQVKKLYEYLEFDDFQEEYIKEYHTRYIKLHA